jgi:hypothetical protein
MEHGGVESGKAPEPAPTAVTGGFASSLVDIFIDPMKVFSRIDAGLSWWKAFIPVAVINILIGWLMMPLNRHVFLLNERGVSAEELERGLEVMDKFGFVGLIMAPIVILLIILILSGIAHLVINMTTSNANFKKTMSLFMWCAIISTIGQLLRTVVLSLKDIEMIQSAADLEVSFSLAALFPGMEGWGKAFFESIGIFEIWFYALFILGTAHVFRIERKKAFIPTIIIWIISFVLLYVRGKFGGGMG